MAKLFASRTHEISERERRNWERARRIGAEGMVLLENKGALPLKADGRKLALYGSGARYTVKGGTGSGDVNSRFVVNVEQGLEEAGFLITTKGWLDRYDAAVETARNAYFAGFKEAMKEGGDAISQLFSNPFREPPVLMATEEDIAASETDTAVYVLPRNSGEGKDRRPVAGDYELFEEEKALIRLLAARYEKLIVVLNVGGVMDTAFFRETEGIGALLLMSQAGNVSGYALADVLTGKVTPCGRLATTWAQHYADYPGASDFSHMNGDLDDEYYREGIFVGYRYFDTFGVTPAYPFGYGLSYTAFEVKTEAVTADPLTVTVRVLVTNTGTQYAGKEVVQVYYSAPEGKLEKPMQELAAYAKTKLLAPGESQTLCISWPLARMASYDPARAAWVLEAGNYYVRVGKDSRNTHIAAALVLERDADTEQLKNCLPLDCEMEELSAVGASPFTYAGETAEKAGAVRIRIDAGQIPCRRAVYQGENEIFSAKTSDEKITADDVKAGRNTLDELVSQLTVEEMAALCVGTARDGQGESIVGAASAVCPGAAGDTTSLMIGDRDVRNMVLADGPAGLRLSRQFMADAAGNMIPGTGEAPLPGMEILAEEKPKIPADAVRYYQYCTAIPIATLLAQTWDLAAIEEAGDIVGEEMEELGVTLWLAPGMNIHRNPLCGRNFEYYSEDPLVAGLCAAADTLGVQKHPGVGTTIKHFALNNQEDNRTHVNAHVGERALREIYLKNFEIAVKRSQPMSIMTSYNLINGTHSANHYDLLTSVARDEWGFAGIVMTDWGTTGGYGSERPFKYGASNAAGCIRAGNDLVMPGSQADVDEIVRSVGAEAGSVPYPITLGDLQACAKRMLNSILQSAAYEDSAPYAASVGKAL